MGNTHAAGGYVADENATAVSSLDAASRDLPKDANAYSAELTVPSELDADGEIKQDGVRRTEAITSVWNKKILLLVFIT